MPKTEWDGKPMLRAFKAIEYLEGMKKMPTTVRIGPLIGRTTNQTQAILYHLWQKRKLLRRKSIKTQRKTNNKVRGCSWYYVLTNKGISKSKKLKQRFGNSVQINIPPSDISNKTFPLQNKPQKAKILSENPIMRKEKIDGITDKKIPPTSKTVLNPDPLTRMQEIDKMMKRNQ